MDRLTRSNFGALPVLPTDGAWGTELMKLGGASTELKDLWNVSEPDKVLQVARSYVEADARIILTNTFSSNAVTLERHGAAIVTEDSYYLPAAARPAVDLATYNFDRPETKEFALLLRHLEAARAGEGFDCPHYDFAVHDRTDETMRIEPGAVLIVEGIHNLGHDEIRALADLTVFVEASADIRRARRDRLRRRARESAPGYPRAAAEWLGLSPLDGMGTRHRGPRPALFGLASVSAGSRRGSPDGRPGSRPRTCPSPFCTRRHRRGPRGGRRRARARRSGSASSAP